MSNDPMQTHGAPSWVQHSGGDPAAARKYYETVLGWQVADMPQKDGSAYAAIMIGGKPVGGFSPMAGDGGWTIFVTVDDVDARVKAVTKAGGRVVSEAMTVPGVGRMATVADPFGAALALIDYSKA